MLVTVTGRRTDGPLCCAADVPLYRALYDYNKMQDDDLSLRVREVLYFLTERDDGWAQVSSREKIDGKKKDSPGDWRGLAGIGWRLQSRDGFAGCNYNVSSSGFVLCCRD